MGREEFRPVSMLVEASVSGEGGEGEDCRPVSMLVEASVSGEGGEGGV